MSDDEATDVEGLRFVEELLDDDDPTGLSREGRRLAERAGRTRVERLGGSVMVRLPSGRAVSLDLPNDMAVREQLLSKLSPRSGPSTSASRIMAEMYVSCGHDPRRCCDEKGSSP